jgi:metallo-beta-lactamase family protein
VAQESRQRIMKLTFLGATGTVTGSKYLLEQNNKKILIDCGLFQGLKDLRLRNWDKLPFDVSALDVVLLTHAHLDHSGYIPLLVKQGFKGPIYCSEATFDLCAILLPDSGYLQEEDAARANRYGYTKHHPALPLYTEQDARLSLEKFKAVSFGQRLDLGERLSCVFGRAGHILGAAQIKVSDGKTSILFSGDVGRLKDPVMKAPEAPLAADYMVVESTYGNRLHEKTNPAEAIGQIIRDTAARGGSVVIPAFAVGRAQSMLYYIHALKTRQAIPDLPVFLDSPMAIDATELLCKHAKEHRLASGLCGEVSRIATYVHTPEESKKLDQGNGMPSVIISASGMAVGGRVLHHLKHFIGDARNTILFAGYQAEGTRGDRLMRGEKEIKIHGQMWPVRAEIINLDNVSAHADYEEMLQWLGQVKSAPRRVFVTHGNAKAAESMRAKIEERLGWKATVPSYLQTEQL